MATTLKTKIGIIGLGAMGSLHARTILEGKIPGLELSAIADENPLRLEEFPKIQHFTNGSKLIQRGIVDGVLIATPHFSHTTLGIEALQKGLHVLVEKPISVHKADCQRLIKEWKDPSQVFAAMFNQRTNPAFIKLKALIDSGELGEVHRFNWIVTDWYRTDNYYANGTWRATWKGEGGGVLLNQCPHNLDLIQWLFGMPSRVTAHCTMGRFHDIEVEDEVTAFLQYDDGKNGVFVTTTGEAPGTNRLEVSTDRGRIVIEDGKMTFKRTEVAVSKHLKESAKPFEAPETWNIDIPIDGSNPQHLGILQNYADAILTGKELIAPASEGIHSIELANAMLYSDAEKSTVELPLDAVAYEKLLSERIANSKFEETSELPSDPLADLTASF